MSLPVSRNKPISLLNLHTEYIPLRLEEKPIKLVLLNEGELRKVDFSLLNEAAHAFCNQYQITMMAARRTYEALKEGREIIRVEFDGRYKHDTFRGALINVEGTDPYDISGKIFSIHVEGEKGSECYYPVISLYVNEAVLLEVMDEEEAVNKIFSVLTHELTHAYTFLMDKENSAGRRRQDLRYQKCIEIIKNPRISKDSLLYSFCYAIYSIHPQEKQAFVAQTYSQMVEILDKMYGTHQVGQKEFINALVRTNTYLTYGHNLELIRRTNSNPSHLEELQDELKRNGLEIETKELNSMLRKIWHNSKDALNKACNNAYHHLFNL